MLNDRRGNIMTTKRAFAPGDHEIPFVVMHFLPLVLGEEGPRARPRVPAPSHSCTLNFFSIAFFALSFAGSRSISVAVQLETFTICCSCVGVACAVSSASVLICGSLVS